MKRTPRVVIPPPRRSVEKMQNGSVLSPPPTGLPPKPSVAVSVGRGRTTERASPSACGGTRDSSSARTTGQHRICLVCGEAAALPNALGGAWPHTPKLRAEAHTHSKLRAFLRKRFYPPPAAQLQRGTSPPLRNPQLSEGTRETISERSSIMKKISNSARAWRPPTARRSGHWRRRPTCP